AALVVIRAVGGSVSLPHQWSPSLWVFTASVIGASATSGACASAVRCAHATSHAVSTPSDAVPGATTSPVLASPQPPKVRTNAQPPSPTCCSPLMSTSRLVTLSACPFRAPSARVADDQPSSTGADRHETQY